MTTGYFIGPGDKTSCGGEVLEGSDYFNLFGLYHAREGDLVSCGKNGKTYQILGGVSHVLDGNRRVAGTLDSISGCPCRAQLTPSSFEGSYAKPGTEPQKNPVAAQPQATDILRAQVQPRAKAAAPKDTYPTPVRPSGLSAQEPGFYIVPYSTTREQLESTLFTLRDPAVMGKFQLLNPNLGDIKAGSMIVLGDAENYQCSRQEALLMELAAQTHDVLATLTPEEAEFMLRHRDEIQTFLARGSAAIGVGEAIFTNNLNNVRNALRNIEALHQRAYLRDGHLRSAAFFAERKSLLAQLDTHLSTLTRKGIGFPDHPNLKRALGISNRSLVHHWRQAGSVGNVPGYATHLEGVAKASKVVKYGGWIGTAVAGGASALKVQEVCGAGKVEACERVRFTETGSFAGSVIGGAAAGTFLSATVVGSICLAIGVPTAGVGTLACGVIVVTAGSIAGSALGNWGGEWIGDSIYESAK